MLPTLIRYQGIGNPYQRHAFTRRNEITYQLAQTPKDVNDTSTKPFDKVYMNQHFNLAYGLGRKGYRWKTEPPGY